MGRSYRRRISICVDVEECLDFKQLCYVNDQNMKTPNTEVFPGILLLSEVQGIGQSGKLIGRYSAATDRACASAYTQSVFRFVSTALHANSNYVYRFVSTALRVNSNWLTLGGN